MPPKKGKKSKKQLEEEKSKNMSSYFCKAFDWSNAYILSNHNPITFSYLSIEQREEQERIEAELEAKRQAEEAERRRLEEERRRKEEEKRLAEELARLKIEEVSQYKKIISLE